MVKGLEETSRDISLKKIHKMVNRHMRRCSISVIIREIKIVTTMMYHLTPVRMAIITKIKNSKCW